MTQTMVSFPGVSKGKVCMVFYLVHMHYQASVILLEKYQGYSENRDRTITMAAQTPNIGQQMQDGIRVLKNRMQDSSLQLQSHHISFLVSSVIMPPGILLLTVLFRSP